MSVRTRTVVVGLLGAAIGLAGCSPFDRWEALRHRIEIERDTLGPAPPAPGPAEKLAVDLDVRGYAGDARPFLLSWIQALDRHPRLDVRGIVLEGAVAGTGPHRTREEPGDVLLTLDCRPVFDGRLSNVLVAFPGMIPFLPLWLGYTWDGTVDVEATAVVAGRKPVSVARSFSVTAIERNARRTAFFHLWPSTGFGGTQFALGFFFAPSLAFYDGEWTTPVLVDALEPRLGLVLADAAWQACARAMDGLAPRPRPRRMRIE